MFTSPTRQSKICSDACRTARVRAAARVWDAAHPEHVRSYHRAYQREYAKTAEQRPKWRVQRAKDFAKWQHESRSSAVLIGLPWSDADNTVVLATDLTQREKARLLGRTLAAVKGRIYNLRHRNGA